MPVHTDAVDLRDHGPRLFNALPLGMVSEIFALVQIAFMFLFRIRGTLIPSIHVGEYGLCSQYLQKLTEYM